MTQNVIQPLSFNVVGNICSTPIINEITVHLKPNKARDTLETQGAPDTIRTAKVLGRPKDSKEFQENLNDFKRF